jgi:hypothetical protein
MSTNSAPAQPRRFKQTVAKLRSVQQVVHLWLAQRDSLRPSHKAQLCLHAAQLLHQASRRRQEAERGRLHWLLGEVAASTQVSRCMHAVQHGLGCWCPLHSITSHEAVAPVTLKCNIIAADV